MEKRQKAAAIASTETSLGRHSVRGLAMMLAQNVVGRFSGLFSQLALAALLAPADFGIVGLAYTVATIVATLTNIGVEDVILQRRRSLYLWSGAAFWINLGVATLGGLLVLLLAPIAAASYGAPRLTGLLAVLALAMPLGTLASVPGMILRSQLQFRVFAVYGSVEIVVQALMTVALAWAGYGPYSFVLPLPILAVVKASIWWHLIGFRPRLRPHRRRWKYLVGNTSAAFLSKLIVALIGQGDYIVLGLLASQSAVGSYYFGFRLAAQPVWILAGNVAGILYPVLIQLKSDPVRQGEAALNASIVLSYCVMPLALIQAAVAGPVLGSLFGQKWTTSIPVIQLLSVGLALDAISWVAGSLLAARGEFAVGLRYVAVQLPIFFGLVMAGALLDQEVGVACAVCAFYAVTQPIFVYGVYRRVGVSLRQVALIYLKPTLYAALAVGPSLVVLAILPFAVHPIAQAAFICLTGGILYIALVRGFAPEVWREVTKRIRGALARNAMA